MAEEFADLNEVGQAVSELRSEVKKSLPDREKIDRINALLDTWEEKVAQPITLAEQERKGLRADLTEYREKLEQAGVRETEAKARVDALEAEIARTLDRARAGDDKAWKDAPEHKAFNSYCRLGKDGMDVEEKQLLRTDDATSGGVLVVTEMDSEITKKITEIDPIRSVARVRTLAGKTLQMPIRNAIPVAQYEGEAEEGLESTATYEAETVTPFRQTFTTPVTIDMLQDASFDMESEISDDAAEAFGFGEGNAFVSGTGFKQPGGIFSNPTLQAGARDTAASGVLDPETVILLTGDLKVGYDPVYVFNRRTLALIRTFRGDAASAGDQAGQFLWMPGLSGPVSNTLNGFPYILANSVDDVTAGLFAMAFGDFRRGYTIVDRTALSVVRDEVTEARKGIVKFTMHRWNTGQVTLPEAIKLLRILP